MLLKNKFKKIIASLAIVGIIGSVAPSMSQAASYHIKAISVAKSNLGVKYKWGGITPKGFDCSGLIRYSYGKAGKSLPRTAADMYKLSGKKVNGMSSLAPGDIMFFAPSKASKPTHAAIYLGKGQMIHAATSKGVSTTSTSNTYWKPKFIGAKRL